MDVPGLCIDDGYVSTLHPSYRAGRAPGWARQALRPPRSSRGGYAARRLRISVRTPGKTARQPGLGAPRCRFGARPVHNSARAFALRARGVRFWTEALVLKGQWVEDDSRPFGLGAGTVHFDTRPLEKICPIRRAFFLDGGARNRNAQAPRCNDQAFFSTVGQIYSNGCGSDLHRRGFFLGRWRTELNHWRTGLDPLTTGLDPWRTGLGRL